MRVGDTRGDPGVGRPRKAKASRVGHGREATNERNRNREAGGPTADKIHTSKLRGAKSGRNTHLEAPRMNASHWLTPLRDLLTLRDFSCLNHEPCGFHLTTSRPQLSQRGLFRSVIIVLRVRNCHVVQICRNESAVIGTQRSHWLIRVRARCSVHARVSTNESAAFS